MKEREGMQIFRENKLICICLPIERERECKFLGKLSWMILVNVDYTEQPKNN
jgi:hypothetical protein